MQSSNKFSVISESIPDEDEFVYKDALIALRRTSEGFDYTVITQRKLKMSGHGESFAVARNKACGLVDKLAG